MTNSISSKFLRTVVAVAAITFAGAVRPAFADAIAVGNVLSIFFPFGGSLNGVTPSDPSISEALFVFDNQANGAGGGIDLGDSNTADLVSFCLQRAEFVKSGNNYYVSNISNATNTGNVLEQQTAWIYHSYRNGGLAGYSVNAIQAAIWSLEGQGIGGLPAGSNINGYEALLAAAKAAVNGGWANNGRVAVVSLLNDNARGDDAQDQLMLTGVQAPEPGSLVLMGAGLLAVARAARRRRKTNVAA